MSLGYLVISLLRIIRLSAWNEIHMNVDRNLILHYIVRVTCREIMTLDSCLDHTLELNFAENFNLPEDPSLSSRKPEV